MKIDTSKLVKAPQLLEAIFAPEVRPSVRCIREWQRRRIIPFYKIGHQVFFDVDKVRAALEKKNEVKAV